MAREQRDQRVDDPRATVAARAPGTAAPTLPDGAHRRLSSLQVGVLIVAAILIAGLAAMYPALLADLARWTFIVGFTLSALVKLAAACTPREVRSTPDPGDDALPAYTVIVPLYREASVAAELVGNLDRLDYPRDRLQVLIVPPGSPQTKPRACNHALARARGALLVIYDAEDAPHPRQLREAAARFAAEGPDLACLQAPLRIEADRRFIGDQFALEYAVQFEVVQPALARWGLPFPLGGTSNHFRGIM